MSRNINSKIELDESCASERLAYDRVQMTEALVKALEKHLNPSDLKYSKTVENAAQVEEKLRMRDTSLKSALEAKKDLIARFVDGRVAKIAEIRDVNVAQQKSHNALKDLLR